MVYEGSWFYSPDLGLFVPAGRGMAPSRLGPSNTDRSPPLTGKSSAANYNERLAFIAKRRSSRHRRLHPTSPLARSYHCQFSADSITIMFAYEFSVRTGSGDPRNVQGRRLRDRQSAMAKGRIVGEEGSPYARRLPRFSASLTDAFLLRPTDVLSIRR